MSRLSGCLLLLVTLSFFGTLNATSIRRVDSSDGVKAETPARARLEEDFRFASSSSTERDSVPSFPTSSKKAFLNACKKELPGTCCKILWKCRDQTGDKCDSLIAKFCPPPPNACPTPPNTFHCPANSEASCCPPPSAATCCDEGTGSAAGGCCGPAGAFDVCCATGFGGGKCCQAEFPHCCPDNINDNGCCRDGDQCCAPDKATNCCSGGSTCCDMNQATNCCPAEAPNCCPLPEDGAPVCCKNGNDCCPAGISQGLPGDLGCCPAGELCCDVADGGCSGPIGPKSKCAKFLDYCSKKPNSKICEKGAVNLFCCVKKV